MLRRGRAAHHRRRQHRLDHGHRLPAVDRRRRAVHRRLPGRPARLRRARRASSPRPTATGSPRRRRWWRRPRRARPCATRSDRSPDRSERHFRSTRAAERAVRRPAHALPVRTDCHSGFPTTDRDGLGADRMGVLDGIKVLEMAGIGPGPFAAMVLADLGRRRAARRPARRRARPAAGRPRERRPRPQPPLGGASTSSRPRASRCSSTSSPRPTSCSRASGPGSPSASASAPTSATSATRASSSGG